VLPSRAAVTVQECTLYAVALFSFGAFAAALYHEAESKALRTRVKMLYVSHTPSRIEAFLTKTASASATRLPRLQLTSSVVKIGCRGNMLPGGSLLNSLTTRAVRHGFAAKHINARRLQLLGEVTKSAREYLDHCNVHSFMSKKPQADFFRRLLGTFPEVLDIMCCLDDGSMADVIALRKGLLFLARGVAHIRDHPGPPLHTAIRECDLGAIGAFLVTEAGEYERKAFGEVLSGMIRGFVPVDLTVCSAREPWEGAQKHSPHHDESARELEVNGSESDPLQRNRAAVDKVNLDNDADLLHLSMLICCALSSRRSCSPGEVDT
jgi:hypothetical protein